MSTQESRVSCQELVRLVPPEKVQEWAAGVVSEKKRRQRRLGAVAMFFGFMLYGLRGMRNLRSALEEAVATLCPYSPPKGLSKGSVGPARERLEPGVLRQGWRHLVARSESLPRRELLAGYRVRCLDGTTLALGDSEANEERYGRPGASRGQTGFPRLRSVLVMEAATYLFIDEAHGALSRSEAELTDEVLPRVVEPGVLLEADRGFYSFERLTAVLRLGGELLVRVKSTLRLPVVRELSDGSYLTYLGPESLSRSKKRRADLERTLSGLGLQELIERSCAERIDLWDPDAQGTEPDSLLMRVIQYDVVDSGGARSPVRLLTSLLDPSELPAHQAAGGYHLRWREELGIREIKWLCDEFRIPHLPGLSPESIEQDYLAVLLAHSVLRTTMAHAAETHGQDPARLSLSGARAVLTRYLPRLPHVPAPKRRAWFSEMLSEIARQRLPPPQNRACPRAVKVKLSKFPTKCRTNLPPSRPIQRAFQFRSPSASAP